MMFSTYWDYLNSIYTNTSKIIAESVTLIKFISFNNLANDKSRMQTQNFNSRACILSIKQQHHLISLVHSLNVC